jgi:HAD superfamily hydrolase (TIGR01509 family)
MVDNKSDFAVIFDMDGVIVNSNPFHRIALRRFCEKHGYCLSDKEMKERIFGRTNKDWLTRLFQENLTRDQLKNLEEEKESLFREIYAEHIKPVRGLHDFLKMLEKNNITRAIATSAPPSNVVFTLEKTATKKFFKVVIDGSDVDRSKPDPEIYLKVTAAIKYPSGKCVVIEDSLSGIEAAREAGCKVIGITTTHSQKDLADTDLVIDHFHELTLPTLEVFF